MHAGYWKGVALGLAVCGSVGFGARQWLTALPAIPAAKSLVFDPPLVSQMQPWILPGQTREFDVQLRNQGSQLARIDELRFSCPCSTGRLGEHSRLPVTIEPGESVPVQVTVTSTRGERGRVELRYGVIGNVGGEHVTPGAMAEFVFAQVLNADLKLVTFGALRRTDPPKSAEIEIWSPSEVSPAEPIAVFTLEPAVTATFQALSAASIGPSSGALAEESAGNKRVSLGVLTITVDPRIAPEKLKADVVVRSGRHEVRVLVLGLTDDSTRAEDSGG